MEKHYTQTNLNWDARNIIIEQELSPDDVLNILDALDDKEAVEIIWEFMQHRDNVHDEIRKQFD